VTVSLESTNRPSTVTDQLLDEQSSVFTVALDGDLPPGRNEFVVKIDGKTFAREVRQRFVIHGSPLELEVVPEPDAAAQGLVRGNLNQELISADHIRPRARTTKRLKN
jgi:hypothetical protein